MCASISGVNSGIPLCRYRNPNLESRTDIGTVTVGQFDWGGRLPKSNGGAQRLPQRE